MIRALLFDFDGLLVDTETCCLTAWQELYREHGHELPLDRWALAVGTIGGFDPWEHLVGLSGKPLDREAALARRLERELALADAEGLRPGVAAYLEGARVRGLATAVVSSASGDWVLRHLGRLERIAHFDAVVTADGDRARAKPRPDLYLDALRRLGVAAREAVAFEDSPNGVRAAKAAGLYCVAVPNGVTEAYGLDEADRVVASLGEVALDEVLREAA